MELVEGSSCAAMFTQNAFCAAPVVLAKKHLQASNNQVRYLLVNTGNANAGTGAEGLSAAMNCCQAVAEATAAPTDCVLPFSTGVIGEPLPSELICNAIPAAVSGLAEDNWAQAAHGILTTDTRPKGASVQFSHEGTDYTVTGIAKGSGMIQPNMATMLAYLATDVAVEQTTLQGVLKKAVNSSFNRITVDGDTSTNDACVLVATGQAGNEPLTTESPVGLLTAFQEAVDQLCIELAQGLIRDGEGASKFVAVVVNGGDGEQECLDVAFTIAHSPLVKTALFASDPNWGRLLAAIGRAGLVDLAVENIALYLNDTLIAEGGCRAASYSEAQGVAAMSPDEIEIRVELNRGASSQTVWTTDFSYDYVRINAEYRS
ncbi:UNVERIFIED_CONTAM: hypothetical protein GTU68_035038 [Idotea baltica]|nr:hypothetical protein [Idotea baltica]